MSFLDFFCHQCGRNTEQDKPNGEYDITEDAKNIIEFLKELDETNRNKFICRMVENFPDHLTFVPFLR